uniref:BTB domain-containing protein n=1 Tax=Caenorhabditis tropicalis TaxID=1561998 RepID=A0A1I7T5X7_9PELO
MSSHSKIINLNIGGTVFQTTKDTLTRFEGMFRTMFETEVPLEKDETGSIFIDRDPKHFRLILNFMRDGRIVLPDSESEIEEILIESSYYLLDGLSQMCQNKNEQLRNFKHIDGKIELLKTAMHSRKPFLVFFYEPENVVRVENFFNEGIFPASITHLEKFIEEFEPRFDFYYIPGGSEEGWACVHYKDYHSTFVAAYSWSRDFLDDIRTSILEKNL